MCCLSFHLLTVLRLSCLWLIHYRLVSMLCFQCRDGRLIYLCHVQSKQDARGQYRSGTELLQDFMWHCSQDVLVGDSGCAFQLLLPFASRPSFLYLALAHLRFMPCVTVYPMQRSSNSGVSCMGGRKAAVQCNYGSLKRHTLKRDSQGNAVKASKELKKFWFAESPERLNSGSTCKPITHHGGQATVTPGKLVKRTAETADL